jgi:putative ABC transport system substrate-binding protein
MNRRDFVATIGGALAAPLVRAQPASGKRTLGVLSTQNAPSAEQSAKGRGMARLRELGWVEGQNLVVERSFSGGRVDVLPELAAELVSKKVDVIWTDGPNAAVAAARATRTIPIVFWAVPSPVELGLVDSLPRPGRNVTGIANTADRGVYLKQFEFLREIAPDVRRVAALAVPTLLPRVEGGVHSLSDSAFGREATLAARGIGLEIEWHIVRQADDLEGAFAAILRSRVQAVVVSGDPLTWTHMRRIAEFTNSNRLIKVSAARQYVEAGALLSYGTDIFRCLLGTVAYVDRILRGAKPADLPVELPSVHELAVNLKTAALIGLKIPRSIIARADLVIE